MTQATSPPPAGSKWDVLDRLVERIGADWLPFLLLMGLGALVLIRLGPDIIKGIVDDRQNRRVHERRMYYLRQKLERRRDKRQNARVDGERQAEEDKR
jgi:hypothetical protein